MSEGNLIQIPIFQDDPPETDYQDQWFNLTILNNPDGLGLITGQTVFIRNIILDNKCFTDAQLAAATFANACMATISGEKLALKEQNSAIWHQNRTHLIWQELWECAKQNYQQVNLTFLAMVLYLFAPRDYIHGTHSSFEQIWESTPWFASGMHQVSHITSSFSEFFNNIYEGFPFEIKKNMQKAAQNYLMAFEDMNNFIKRGGLTSNTQEQS